MTSRSVRAVSDGSTVSPRARPACAGRPCLWGALGCRHVSHDRERCSEHRGSTSSWTRGFRDFPVTTDTSPRKTQKRPTDTEEIGEMQTQRPRHRPAQRERPHPQDKARPAGGPGREGPSCTEVGAPGGAAQGSSETEERYPTTRPPLSWGSPRSSCRDLRGHRGGLVRNTSRPGPDRAAQGDSDEAASEVTLSQPGARGGEVAPSCSAPPNPPHVTWGGAVGPEPQAAVPKSCAADCVSHPSDRSFPLRLALAGPSGRCDREGGGRG